jgi:type III secretion protein C
MRRRSAACSASTFSLMLADRMAAFSSDWARSLLLALALVASVALGSAACHAVDAVPWPNPAAGYFKVAQNQPIDALLREFAADQGLPISMSENVTGAISGQFGPMPPQQFLDRLTQANGLIWYFDGHALFVYRSDELASEMVALQSATATDVLEKLERLGLLSERFPIKSLPENNLLYISGPPRYLEVIKGSAESIDSSTQNRVRVELAVEVFPLQNAWADDQAFFFNGQQVIMPGVATILRNLVTGQQTQGLGGRMGPLPNFNLPSLRGQGLGFRQNLALAQSQQASVNAQVAAAEANARVSVLERREEQSANQEAAEAAVQAVIQADQRLNAVVIRDVKSRLEYYREIIRQLDQPSGLVQIEAHIIDVDASAGFQFGMPYNAAWQSGGDDARAGSLGITDLAPNFTLRYTENGVNQLLFQLRALESDGRARFVSRPTVLTLNNMEAHLDSTSTFFVRVEGNEEVDLFDVTVGTMMRIVPHIICEPTGRRVKLITRIEDGRQTQDEVDLIPVIDRNTINTQAVLNEGESLLIGGLIREETTKNESRIPILGRLPAVGFLFSTVDSQKEKFERIVLIRPRIIDLPCPGGVETGLQPLLVESPMVVDPIPYGGDGVQQPQLPPGVELAPGEQLVVPPQDVTTLGSDPAALESLPPLVDEVPPPTPAAR